MEIDMKKKKTKTKKSFRNKKKELRVKLQPFIKYKLLKSFSTSEGKDWEKEKHFYKLSKNSTLVPLGIYFPGEIDLKNLNYNKKEYTVKIVKIEILEKILGDTKKSRGQIVREALVNAEDIIKVISSPKRNDVYFDNQIFIEIKSPSWKGSLRDYYFKSGRNFTKKTLGNNDLLDQLLALELIKRAQSADVNAIDILVSQFLNEVKHTYKFFAKNYSKINSEDIEETTLILCWLCIAGDKIEAIMQNIISGSQPELLFTRKLEGVILDYVDKKIPYTVWTETGLFLTRNGKPLYLPLDNPMDYMESEEMKEFLMRNKKRLKLSTNKFKCFKQKIKQEYKLKYDKKIKKYSSSYIKYEEYLKKISSLKGKNEILKRIKERQKTLFQRKVLQPEAEEILQGLKREANPLWGLIGNIDFNKELFDLKKRKKSNYPPGISFNVWLFGVPGRKGVLYKRLQDWFKAKKEKESRKTKSFEDIKESQQHEQGLYKEHNFGDLPQKFFRGSEVDLGDMEIEKKLREYKKREKIKDRDIKIIKFKLQKDSGTINKDEYKNILQRISLSEKQKRRIFLKFKKWNEENKT